MASDFGASLAELAQRFHVWVVDTPRNRRAAEALWADASGNRIHSVTTFNVPEDESTEASLVDLLVVIDEHHGLRAERSTDVVLEVLGALLTPRIRAKLDTLGPFSVQEHARGFVAIRTPGV